MELFGIILLAIGVALCAFFFWFELLITNDRIQFLEDRLFKLEKDAVKITFSPKSKPKTQTDYQNEFKKPLAKKRKPKTVTEWEDEIDLGGHE
jgi:hypothetical protein